MNVVLVTMEVKSGQCETNFEYMKTMIHKAEREQADMIVFPQNAISGYYVGDAWHDDAWCSYVDSFNMKIQELSSKIAIVWGNIKYRRGNRFNAVFFAYQDALYTRVKAKETGVFAQDDAFSQLSINSPIEFKDITFALNFGKELQLADFNINVDAKPFDIHEQRKIKGNVIYVNAVGMQNVGKGVVVMEGGSYISQGSQLCYQMEYGKAGYDTVELEELSSIKEKPADLCDMLAIGIRGFDEQVLHQSCNWIVGLSGGLDSSVSAALLCYALGNKRVFGYGMSTTYNSAKTKNNATFSAEALAITYQDGSIEPLVEASKQVLKDYGYESVEGLALENIQARLRGHLLSSFASLHGGVVVNNGNKVENALGYCTLYGDAIGALGILGDLTKVQLFDLAYALNEKFGKVVIPPSLLPILEHDQILWDVAPAAELKEDQVDPMKWMYHDYLVDHLGRDLSVKELLTSYLDESILQDEVGKWIRFYGLDEPEAFLSDLDWFLKTAKRNQFKHLQVPAILSVSKNSYAFVKEVQGSFDEGYLDNLKRQILEMKKG